MFDELKLIKSNIKVNQNQIEHEKNFLQHNDFKIRNEKEVLNLEDQEMVQIRYFLKNE